MIENIKVKCKRCGEIFYITESEIRFYVSKNFELPKRCYECRQAVRTAKITAEAEIK